MKKYVINSGNKYGLLSVICESNKRGKIRYFSVKCSKCGRIFETNLSFFLKLKEGQGCICVRGRQKGQKNKTHKEYRINEIKLNSVFRNIRRRCSERFKLDRGWMNYGGKGIKCEWNNFEEFYNDMALSYEEGLSIDRINSDGNYCKENCRWADRKMQNNNRSSNIIIEGRFTLKQWTEKYISPNMKDYYRALHFFKKGLNPDQVLNKFH